MSLERLERRCALITGASGFIGRHAVEEFGRRGFDVVPVSRGDSPDFRGVDVLVHLAGLAHVAGPARGGSSGFHVSNVELTRSLAVGAADAGVKRVVFLSSASVYGSRSSSRAYSRHDCVAPADSYAQSKVEAERVLSDVLRGTNTACVIVRAPMVYGPNSPGTFSRLAKLLAKNPVLPLAGLHNRRSMVSVWNLCDFLMMASVHPNAAKSELPWLVSDGRDVSTTELVTTMAAALEVTPRLFKLPKGVLELSGALTGRRAEIRRLLGSFVLDIDESRSLLGWHPPVSFEQGVIQALGQGR